jgi:septum site-determining protein MinD
LQDVLEEKHTIQEAIATHPTGLKIIPANIGIESIDSDISNLKYHLQQLNGTIILDSPPGLGEDALQIIDACDDVIIVTSPELPTLTNAVKTIKVARELKKNVIGVIINKSLNEDHELTPNEIEMMCESHVLSNINYDTIITRSLSKKTPIIEFKPYSESAIEYKKVAAKILGKNYQTPKFLFFKRLYDQISNK